MAPGSPSADRVGAATVLAFAALGIAALSVVVGPTRGRPAGTKPGISEIVVVGSLAG